VAAEEETERGDTAELLSERVVLLCTGPSCLRLKRRYTSQSLLFVNKGKCIYSASWTLQNSEQVVSWV
jgi:hypothetical protein